MPALLTVPPLEGTLVRLEPLELTHVDDLVAAQAMDRGTYTWTKVPSDRDAMAAYVGELTEQRAAGEVVPFAQVPLAGGRAAGCTRFLTLRRRPDRELPYAVEVGGTWLGSRWQRTGVNNEAKLLLLTHAFEVWGVGRVDLKTDARNERSRTAIAALGARFEGVLRAWQPSQVVGEEDGLRDTAIYSVLAGEWPAVRDRLRTRMARASRPARSA